MWKVMESLKLQKSRQEKNQKHPDIQIVPQYPLDEGSPSVYLWFQIPPQSSRDRATPLRPLKDLSLIAMKVLFWMLYDKEVNGA